MNVFGIVEIIINKVKDPLYPLEKDLLKNISEKLPIKHKEIFDYQINKYNSIRRNKFSKEIYFYYLKYGYIVKAMEKQFEYSEKTKILAYFSISIEKKIYKGVATVINGRFFSLRFDDWIDLSKIRNYEISIDKVKLINI